MDRNELTTLCYLIKDHKYLMLHRVKKDNDINKDKYIGIGGHLEHGESPDDCIYREIKEETGLDAYNLKLRGLLTFVIDDYDEYSFLYTGEEFAGELKECDEGELIFIDKDKVKELPIWEGDKIFFELLDKRDDFFSLKLVYVHDELKDAYLDGEKIYVR
ncbi:MAG: 8-oxo-dGTP diphosphatase [Erysipelotrichaceae bacterium]|nr:8-oxo-dGTP diphosphatase [Erysipelotrichaceae bacterium]